MLNLHFPTNHSTRAALRAALSGPLFVLIYFGSYWLRFEGDWNGPTINLFLSTFVWVASLKVAAFAYFRVYQSWGRYLTFHDLMLLLKAATTSSFAILLMDFLLYPGLSTPRSVFLMDWGLTIVALGGMRSLTRLLDEQELSNWFTQGLTPALIVGANDSGEALLRAIRRNPRLTYRVVGFIAGAQESADTHIAGVPVIGSLDETCELAQKHQVSDVFITAGELSGQQVRDLVDRTRVAQINVRVLPSYEQLLSGRVDLRPREVSIEDLLRREPVRLNMAELHRWIDDRVLLVTGSAGSIGSEICRQLLQFSPRRLVLVDRSENGQFFLERELRRLVPDLDIEICIGDVTDAARMRSLFRTHRPDIVFHAAAYKHVPLMEAHPGEAVKNIVLATKLLADEAEACGVSSFVMISTDKAVNPTSVMGVCKRVAELYVQAKAAVSHCQFVTVRFGNVLDSAGSVVPLFRQQIAAGGPVTVTHPEMVRYFMTIPEASQLVIQAGAMGRGGEIFVLDMGDPVKIVDLARDMIRLSGLELGKDIDIEFVGQRPGEKLFEELNCDDERHRPTSHSKIMVAESGRADLAVLQGALEHLQQMANGNAASIFAVLKKIVPAYAAAKIPAQPRIGGGRMPVIAGLTRESAMPTESSRDVIPIGERLSEPTRERRKAA
jgi:FlaA1/EpsC-like NDP-sugar epimerase